MDTQPLRIVIVGGVAGGASAAAKARRTNEHADITLFERGPHVSFANCGLPYYVGGDIAQRDALLLQTPESFWRRFAVKVHVYHEVMRIDRTLRHVEVRNVQTGQRSLHPYDKLILSPGAGAVVPELPGLPARNVFTVKTVPDSDAILQWLRDAAPTHAVVAGAGFIGLETAEALHRRGLRVSVVELQPQVLPAFDPDMAAFVQAQVQRQGIEVWTSRALAGLETELVGADQVVRTAVLDDGTRLPADVVVMSIGVRPELRLAREAGLRIGATGGIAVDDRQRTSDPDIYAAGDAVEVVQRVTGQAVRMPLAGPAGKQGRVAGANAAGGDLRFPGALGTAIVETMGITAAKTGLSEREARAAGFDVQVTQTHSLDHAGYYPGASLMHLKLVADRATHRLLGGQIVGEAGVDKRIDVLATALQAGMTVMDLEELDLAYAPQFSSARDPVIMAGFAASNVARNEVQTVTCAALQAERSAQRPVQLVDVRTAGEFEGGHLPGAHHLPIDELRGRLAELDPDADTVVYCKVGFRGYLAARILSQSGFGRVRNLTGGMLQCDAGAPA
ncbi:MAG: FAD-dependent oxidoreductase [Deltaproteobacteria bacterium]|nr:FAD-dependent oxidoreductase [Deltaproteobacteria bacterium]